MGRLLLHRRREQPIVPLLMQPVRISIGGLCFRLMLDEILEEPPIAIDAFLPFMVPNEAEDVLVQYRLDEQVEKYAIDVFPDGSQVEVRIPSWQIWNFTYVRGCLMFIPMEEVLLRHNRFFLHASFIASPFGGLLFTGDSGVGKSTQAELWREHMGSTIINGDRTIVAKEENGWRAYGSPYAGSSEYYVKRDEPIRAIILLEQATENQVDVVSPAEAFRRLFLQVSMDHSKPEQVNRLCDLLMELTAAVPIYRLRCTPDVRAVNALCEALRKERADG